MVNCSVRNCKNKSVKGNTLIAFYSFPKKESVANEWLRYCKPKTTCKNGRICSKHFTSSDYNPPSLRHILMNESPPRRMRKLKPDAIPTLQIDSEEKSNSTDLTAKSVCTGGQTDNCETKENYDISAPSCNIFKVKVHSPWATQESGKFWSDKKITMSEAEYKLLKRKVDECEVLKNNLKRIFTPGQIRCLKKPNRNRVVWSAEDIAAAISLRSISPNGYEYLRATVGIPLPGYSTLRNWEVKKLRMKSVSRDAN